MWVSGTLSWKIGPSSSRSGTQFAHWIARFSPQMLPTWHTRWRLSRRWCQWAALWSAWSSFQCFNRKHLSLQSWSTSNNSNLPLWKEDSRWWTWFKSSTANQTAQRETRGVCINWAWHRSTRTILLMLLQTVPLCERANSAQCRCWESATSWGTTVTRNLEHQRVLSRHSAFNTNEQMVFKLESQWWFNANDVRVLDILCNFLSCFIISLSCFILRKGVICHQKIVESLLEGMQIGAGDKILLIDCLPNRQACCLYETAWTSHTWLLIY